MSLDRLLLTFEDQWSIIVEKFSPFNMFNTWNSFKVGLWWLLMVRSICRAPVCRVGGREFTPRTGPTLMITVLKLLRRMCYLCSDICKWSDILVFSDEDEKTVSPFSYISSVLADGGRWIIYTLISESREHSSQCCGLALFLKMGHLQKFTSKIVNCLMQSGQSPKQYFVKHHEPLDMVL